MAHDSLFAVSVVYSIIAGTAAGVLSVQTWETLRHSPFGRAVFALTAVLVLFSLYHVLLLLFPEPPVPPDLVESLMPTGWVSRQITP
jgi:hypothetical protein